MTKYELPESFYNKLGTHGVASYRFKSFPQDDDLQGIEVDTKHLLDVSNIGDNVMFWRRPNNSGRPAGIVFATATIVTTSPIQKLLKHTKSLEITVKKEATENGRRSRPNIKRVYYINQLKE